MNKLSNRVLNNISENNNEYRTYLRELDSSIDEKTTALIGEIVTLSNYVIDFSNTIYRAKEELVAPLSKVVESYVIRDLRSVESVNEQFIEKINDKIEETQVNNQDDLNRFKESLNTLLNDKYLEIVKIKRIEFLNEENVNSDIENIIDSFAQSIKEGIEFNESNLNELISSYKNEVYDVIRRILSQINDLYLNNFVNEILSSLNITMDGINTLVNKDIEDDLINQIPAVEESVQMVQTSTLTDDLINEIPVIEDVILPSESDYNNQIIDEVPLIPDVEISNKEDELINDLQSLETPLEEFKPEEVISSLEVPSIEPIEVNNVIEPKKTYDVEEILKIAKSPVVTMPEVSVKKQDDSYVHVAPIVNEELNDSLDSEYNEAEIVEELISRLTKRLDVINERKAKYVELKEQIEEDEAFVNDLIESAEAKKEELNQFEKELDEKEKELKEKELQLNKKINDVMPFANALLKNEEESL